MQKTGLAALATSADPGWLSTAPSAGGRLGLAGGGSLAGAKHLYFKQKTQSK
jgi:hypothetical protein